MNGNLAKTYLGDHFFQKPMFRHFFSIILIFSAVFLFSNLFPISSYGAERFPSPDFQSDYTIPNPNLSATKIFWFEYLDLTVLLSAMILAVLFIYKWRTRNGLFLLSIFCLIYFGFYRQGCICPAGSLQNMALAFFDHSYIIPVTILIIFMLPLVFTLFYGRVFCGTVCPLGAIQDLIIFRPVKLPAWLSEFLGMIPYLYFGLAMIWVATGSGFLICQYDPFIAFFHRSGPATTLALGFLFLLIGTMIGRPYCRFFCPYGVLLGWFAFFSRQRLQITPDECIQCRLCEDACPNGALRKPSTGSASTNKRAGIRRLAFLLVLLPVFIGVTGFTISKLVQPLANTNPQVNLYRQIAKEEKGAKQLSNLEIQAFRESGDSNAMLYQKAFQIWQQFHFGGWLLGILLGFVVWFKIIRGVIIRTRSKYEPDPVYCFNCGRCLSYCPKNLVVRGGSNGSS